MGTWVDPIGWIPVDYEHADRQIQTIGCEEVRNHSHPMDSHNLDD
jgi:hypothetical protein